MYYIGELVLLSTRLRATVKSKEKSGQNFRFGPLGVIENCPIDLKRFFSIIFFLTVGQNNFGNKIPDTIKNCDFLTTKIEELIE